MEIKIEYAAYIYDSIISRVIIGGRQGATDYGLLATCQACTGTQYGYGCWGKVEDPEIYHMLTLSITQLDRTPIEQALVSNLHEHPGEHARYKGRYKAR